jgi:hypothetical protein
MISIPSTDKRYSQPNNSDLFGNVWYGRNLSYDDQGYIKLASRSVQIKSEKDDEFFGLPVSFGRQAGGTFYIPTTVRNYIASITPNPPAVSIAQDVAASVANTASNTFGKWWQSRWHVTNTTEMRYKTSGAWTDTGVSLNASYPHPVEVFRSLNTICVGNGNVVKQYDTSYSVTTDLTIPSDYTVIGLSFSNNKMGIITQLNASGLAGQNQEAYFFVWDGGSTSASIGLPIGSDFIVAITAYKSSWVILTRTGQVKYFNGGGWDIMTTLPFFYKNLIWANFSGRIAYGDVMVVDGEKIYININSLISTGFGKKGEKYLENFPGGLLCYDPNVGIYHKYSPSLSPANIVRVPQASVNTTTNIFTKDAGTVYITGNPVKYIATTSISGIVGGLTSGTIYYVIRLSATDFKLATTKANADAGIAIDITTTGDTNNYFMFLNLLDYGASRFNFSGGIGLMGLQNKVYDGILYGAQMYDFASITEYNTLCMTVAGFDNRGYFVTPKITSPNLQDLYQGVYIKFKPLGATDKIIIKQKSSHVIGIPTSTPQLADVSATAVPCTWTSTTTFTTTNDFSEVLTYLATSGNECEVEIIAGAGAGQMAQISTISFNAGTYTVTLAEELDGIASGRVSDVLINNWKKFGEIDSSNTDNYAEFSIGSSATWNEFKVELRGNETTIEEFQIINKTFMPSN